MVTRTATRRGTRSVILMDVLASLALIGGAVMVLLVFFRTEMHEVRRSHERAAAQLVAESEIERLRTLSYDEIPVHAGRALPLSLPSAKRLKEARILLTVKEVEPGLKQVAVRVEWLSRRGRPLAAEMAAVFSREARRP